MINQIYRLVSARQFEISYKERSITDQQVVVRPTHLSICAADQRYYTGKRGEEAMKKKLPMALIHEGIGEVSYDPKNIIPVGTRVVMVPNMPTQEDEFVAENYRVGSQFRSSGYDGFMQDYVFLNRDRLVFVPDNISSPVAAFTELVTIATHAISRFEKKAIARRGSFGVWGDGNLGYITCLLLKYMYPKCKVTIFGKTQYKLDHFSFVDEAIFINDIPQDYEIDHAIECAGGKGSQYAIDQMIDICKPEGTLGLLGVSEFPVEINTRMVLEKGLTLFGSSRSGSLDFQNTMDLYEKHPEIPNYLSTLVGNITTVTTVKDIIAAFEEDLSRSWGKSVMEWKI
ncbi:ribitol-5-phosphate dehydrogenase [Kurthia sibirica]|uniref:Ribulose-5-phosphate reductase n=1 Tax=Kurthia sibirica TaxID=202750 RepID=A0A2U3AL08_9BACL|nr:ribitol-5-phosphate dehydrogenase [Kurthia sibirica]PWI25204.1 ribitol-5-phosphate dehydrogenase [Kurthia sibirica]GEK35188.1 ribitol-5-phosphate dehydrogenase [Kurthia sibirica]